MFFVSSRRLHTRCGRDWSSDVCSSDLNSVIDEKDLPAEIAQGSLYVPEDDSLNIRSEARRVGKENRQMAAEQPEKTTELFDSDQANDSDVLGVAEQARIALESLHVS